VTLSGPYAMGAEIGAASIGFWVGLAVLTVIIAPEAVFFIGRSMVRAIRFLCAQVVGHSGNPTHDFYGTAGA
jgi:hypothetical protein